MSQSEDVKKESETTEQDAGGQVHALLRAFESRGEHLRAQASASPEDNKTKTMPPALNTDRYHFVHVELRQLALYMRPTDQEIRAHGWERPLSAKNVGKHLIAFHEGAHLVDTYVLKPFELKAVTEKGKISVFRHVTEDDSVAIAAGSDIVFDQWHRRFLNDPDFQRKLLEPEIEVEKEIEQKRQIILAEAAKVAAKPQPTPDDQKLLRKGQRAATTKVALTRRTAGAIPIPGVQVPQRPVLKLIAKESDAANMLSLRDLSHDETLMTSLTLPDDSAFDVYWRMSVQVTDAAMMLATMPREKSLINVGLDLVTTLFDGSRLLAKLGPHAQKWDTFKQHFSKEIVNEHVTTLLADDCKDLGFKVNVTLKSMALRLGAKDIRHLKGILPAGAITETKDDAARTTINERASASIAKQLEIEHARQKAADEAAEKDAELARKLEADKREMARKQRDRDERKKLQKQADDEAEEKTRQKQKEVDAKKAEAQAEIDKQNLENELEIKRQDGIAFRELEKKKALHKREMDEKDAEINRIKESAAKEIEKSRAELKRDQDKFDEEKRLADQRLKLAEDRRREAKMKKDAEDLQKKEDRERELQRQKAEIDHQIALENEKKRLDEVVARNKLDREAALLNGLFAVVGQWADEEMRNSILAVQALGVKSEDLVRLQLEKVKRGHISWVDPVDDDGGEDSHLDRDTDSKGRENTVHAGRTPKRPALKSTSTKQVSSAAPPSAQ